MNITKAFTAWKQKRALKRAMVALRNVDYLMIKTGMSRKERRQFWTEFTKDREVRDQTIAKMENTLRI